MENPLPYLMLDIKADLVQEIGLLHCGELLVGDDDGTVFVSLLDVSSDVDLPSSFPQRARAAILDEHPGWGEGEGVDGEVRHPRRRWRAFFGLFGERSGWSRVALVWGVGR